MVKAEGGWVSLCGDIINKKKKRHPLSAHYKNIGIRIIANLYNKNIAI